MMPRSGAERRAGKLAHDPGGALPNALRLWYSTALEREAAMVNHEVDRDMDAAASRAAGTEASAALPRVA